mgnify:FL=1|tara:strand:+ start:2389 stop:3378 length:990 start_codon:yes stop_codon:yes gene_type:complete
MAIATNTRTTYGAIGIREDLSNIIYNISPMDTPFLSGVGKGSADNTLFEWQTDELTAAAANQQLEGDDSMNALAVAEPTRLTNYCQISYKAVQSSGTAEAVDFAGRKSSQAYQLAKRAKEIKRDMEKMLLSNDVKVAGAAGTARKTAAVMSWLGTGSAGTSNIILGSASPVVGVTNTAAGTHFAAFGTPAVLTMAMINLAMERCFTLGGEPSTIMAPADLKQKISALGGSVLADIQSNAAGDKPTTAVNAIDVLVTDFGTLKIVPSRLMLADMLFFVDFDFWSVDYLRPFQTETLAKTGDSIKQLMIAEYGLRAKNGLANAAVIGVKDA